ncbi:MAG: hypothetical protein GXP31_05710 [Kiritimatiellaeota bacterium]|nr:hypothetical protein [Kiritimatiellota bacterium]
MKHSSPTPPPRESRGAACFEAGMDRRQAIQRMAWLAAVVPGLTTVASAAGAPPERGLVAWWNFDSQAPGDPGGDATGNGHELDLAGLTAVPGAVGSALRFPGAPGWKAATPITADLSPERAVTVACWVRPTEDMSGVEGAGIVSAGNSYLLRISSGMRPSFHIFTEGWGPVITPDAIRVKQWYHVAGVYDGRRMAIYLNGRLAAARPRAGAIQRAKGELTLGRQVNSLDGDLDEVRVYDRALSEAEIQRLFQYDRQRLRAGVLPGTTMEPFESRFGRTRHRPAPPASDVLLPAADLTFALFTDTHIGAPGEEGQYCHNWRVEAMIDQINALKPAFVVNCGDIITTFPDREIFRDQCTNAVKMHKRLTVPVYLTPGNHDVGDQLPMQVFGPGEDARRAVKPAFIRAYRKAFGRDYYAFRHGPYHFTVINGSLMNSGLPDEAAQWTFLERELAAARDARARFAFIHNPPFWRTPDEPVEGNYEPIYPPARDRLLDLLHKNGVAVLFCGHTHFPFSNRWRNLEIVTLNSSTFNRNFPEDGTRLPGAAEIYDPYKIGWLVVRLRDRRWHGIWVNTYERERPLPSARKTRDMGPRLLAGTPAGSTATALNTVTGLPRTVFRQTRNRHGRPRTSSTAYDIEWRLPEVLGSRWSLVRIDDSAVDGDAIRDTLDHRPLRNTETIWTLPLAEATGDRMLQLVRRRKDVRRLLVENGHAASPAAPLTSWVPAGPDVVRRRCILAKDALPHAELTVGRWPLAAVSDRAREFEQYLDAARAAGAAAVTVWTSVQTPPEERLWPALQRAQGYCAARDLDLWVEAACFQRVPEPLRTARFLRLLALAFSARVPLFWWLGTDDAGGLLDRHLDPTPRLRAGALWNELARDAARVGPVEHRRGLFSFEWTCGGKRRQVWWRTGEALKTAPPKAKAPAWANVTADLLAGRQLPRARALPVMPWPRVAVET